MAGLAIHRTNPLEDPRWRTFVEGHPRASVFHSPEWLEALRRTYGYEPIGLTTSAPGEKITNGVVFCRVKSWLTGRRMVSLPFSDHCQPLAETEAELEHLVYALEVERATSRSRYVEIRPIDLAGSTRSSFNTDRTFYFHRLSLKPTLDEIFHGFHKDCVQRKIRRAQREELSYEDGRSDTLLDQFYQLLTVTRRRHGLPPQPLTWFRNLIACMGDKLKIRVTSKDGRPVASILTLQNKDTLTYKYGGSDRSLSNLGGMQLLFWKTIEEAKRDGLAEFDMGRSDWHNHGLVDFKKRWGATQSELAYLRYQPQRLLPSVPVVGMLVARQLFALAPNGLILKVGRALYRHLG
jgi:lipid II:glycine glycyltransferase (peptidoglycan interpeptide bridge formation enzyme)